MSIKEGISFVVAVNDDTVFKNNIATSPIFNQIGDYEIIIKSDYKSAAMAYNEAIATSKYDLLIFAHQDVYFPETWIRDLEKSLNILEEQAQPWGVLGCWGVSVDNIRQGHVYSSGLGCVLGESYSHPKEVQTLDELVLIIRKSSKLRFDESLPNFHFYGTDICIAAAQRGLKSYAINAFCIHNSNGLNKFPKEFYTGYKYLKKRYSTLLPIQTTCIRITKDNKEYYAYRLRNILRIFKSLSKNMRQDNPRSIWLKVNNEKNAHSQCREDK
jgi:hypothetical protein